MEQEEIRDNIIEAKDVAMQFNLATERVDSLKEYIIRAVKHQLSYDEFWGLKGISFDVKRGDSVGLIGVNGSGKSTILKIIAGVLKPTKGSIRVKGSIAPMIELGAGFDLDLTGRENIYLNGALLGRNHKMMDAVYDEIVDFSELADFMDVPVKNYSSGMLSRLAFSIATSGDTDILIVDEVLAVGDHDFQMKCLEKIRRKMKQGTTVLFVSHDMELVRSICNRVIWLDGGLIHAQGDVESICREYESRHREEKEDEA